MPAFTQMYWAHALPKYPNGVRQFQGTLIKWPVLYNSYFFYLILRRKTILTLIKNSIQMHPVLNRWYNIYKMIMQCLVTSKFPRIRNQTWEKFVKISLFSHSPVRTWLESLDFYTLWKNKIKKRWKQIKWHGFELTFLHHRIQIFKQSK